jgi:hypothetical protein
VKRDPRRRLTGVQFSDEFVQQGLEGGKKSVSLLKQAVEAEIRTSFPSLPAHIEIVVRVYANTEGLGRTYARLKLATESTFLSFVRGFNMGHTLSDFVDAGNEKECADEKIKGSSSRHIMMRGTRPHINPWLSWIDTLPSNHQGPPGQRPLSASLFWWLVRQWIC